MRWGKRVQEAPPVKMSESDIKLVENKILESAKIRPVYEGYQSTKPSLEDIYYEVSKQYGYGGYGGSGNREEFTRKAQEYQDYLAKNRRFEQWSRYEEPKIYGVGTKIIIDHSPPEPVEPVPQGKTLDELFEEDDE